MNETQAIGRRGALAGIGAAGAMMVITARDARAQGVAMTYVAPFSFILAFADVLHAEAGGFFEREGLKVTIEQARGSSMALQQVVAGNALLSRTGGVDHVKAVVGQNAPAISVGTIAQASPFFVISHADRPIRGPGDMKGKTIFEHTLYKALRGWVDPRQCERFDGFRRFEIAPKLRGA